MNQTFKILSTTAILGYGFPIASFEAGLAKKPDLIAADAGSTDPGPYYLGSGVSFTDRQAVKRDLRLMISAGLERKIPVIIGSAGGSGAEPHLNGCLEIVREIAAEEKLRFKLAVIHAEFDQETIVAELNAGKITSLDRTPPLTAEKIRSSEHIVGQMGIEPFMRALDAQPDVIVAGRAYDPSVFASLPIKRGFDRALALHLGKILECAAICASPGSGSDCMFGTLSNNWFELEALNPTRKCTTVSVAAHTLYEKSNPYLLPGPGGMLDLRNCQFTDMGNGRIRVTGSKFVPAEKYTIKLEGAAAIGYRTVSIAGVRDPIMIREIDNTIEAVRSNVADIYKDHPWNYHLNFIVYGRDGVMGALEPHPNTDDVHELGIVIEAVADTQSLADTVCATARSTMLHYGYPGRIATAGNLAFPFSPSDFHAGKVYEFSVYHLLETDRPADLFKIDYLEIDETDAQATTTKGK